MTTEEICWELKTIDMSELAPKEERAIHEAIPILKRCEKYRKALQSIDAALFVGGASDYYETRNAEAMIAARKIIAEAFDYEEE